MIRKDIGTVKDFWCVLALFNLSLIPSRGRETVTDCTNYKEKTLAVKQTFF